jgi:hypothetical protein
VATGIQNGLEISPITIFPNPSSGNFSVNVSSKSTKTITVSVANILGETVSTQQFQINSGSNEIKMGMPTSCMNGVYFVTIDGMETRQTQRIILNR